jgi:cysteine desulfurase
MALTDARHRLAQILGCSASAILWTSGASESNNTVFHHFATKLAADGEIWVSAIEHPSVLEPVRRYFKDRTRLIPVTPEGVVRLDWVEDKLKQSRPGLIVLMAANNETGVLQPWREALALAREHNTPTFCDAVQWIGKLPADGLGACDFVSGTAHKFGGPRGVGFLKCPEGQRIEPLICGGPQEDGRRAGTENVASILALLAILEHRQVSLARGEQRDAEVLRNEFEAALTKSIPDLTVIGSTTKRLWNTSAVIMPNLDCRQRWVVKLDKLGFAVSTGSACSSGKEKASHVLSAMGFDPKEAGRALRFSAGWETTPADWHQLLAAIREAHRSFSS